MTTRPELFTSKNQIYGILAVALFGVMSAVFVTSEFQGTGGFGDGSTTATIGYALLNLEGPLPTEGFLVPFEIVDVVLIAALAAAVMLASRPGEGGVAADGGRQTDEESGDAGAPPDDRDRGGDR